MQKPNCKCLACGKEYYFCITCSKQRSSSTPAWHIDFCDETCKTVFETISDYNTGSYTKEEAAEKIKNCDLSKNFKQSLKDKIKEIQKTTKSSKEEKISAEKFSKEDSSVGLMAPSTEDKGDE